MLIFYNWEYVIGPATIVIGVEAEKVYVEIPADMMHIPNLTPFKYKYTLY